MEDMQLLGIIIAIVFGIVVAYFLSSPAGQDGKKKKKADKKVCPAVDLKDCMWSVVLSIS